LQPPHVGDSELYSDTGLKASLDQDDARPHSASIQMQGLIRSGIRMVEVLPPPHVGESESYSDTGLKASLDKNDAKPFPVFVIHVRRDKVYNIPPPPRVYATLIHGLNSLYGRW
jgi:hypothetical protein